MPPISPENSHQTHSGRHVLGIFVKEPEAGKVKTRLGSEIGYENSARLYEAFVQDLLAKFQSLPDRLILGFSPNSSEATNWANSLCQTTLPGYSEDDTTIRELWPQPEGKLGERIIAYFEHAFRSPETESVVLIGSDSPTLPREYIEQAFEWLYQKECVIGPSADGGYYLIGLRNFHRDLFQQVHWSGAKVLAQTVAKIKKAGVSLKLLPVWYDVDSKDDLEMLKGHLDAMKLSGEKELPEQTANWVSNWSAD